MIAGALAGKPEVPLSIEHGGALPVPDHIKALENEIRGELGRQIPSTVFWLRTVADDLERTWDGLYNSIRGSGMNGARPTMGSHSNPTADTAEAAADPEAMKHYKNVTASAVRLARSAVKLGRSTEVALREASSAAAQILDPDNAKEPPPLSQRRSSISKALDKRS